MSKKRLTENEMIVNRLSSDLLSFTQEYNYNTLTVEDIFSYFSEILIDAGVDSRIIVDVLEQTQFGQLGQNEALSIKINEGW